MTGPVNPKTFSYDIPTSNEDGSPLARADIVGFEIGIGSVSKAYVLVFRDVTVEAAAKQVTAFSQIGKIPYGQCYASVRTISHPAGATADVVGNWGAEVTFIESPPLPSAPGGFTVA